MLWLVVAIGWYTVSEPALRRTLHRVLPDLRQPKRTPAGHPITTNHCYVDQSGNYLRLFCSEIYEQRQFNCSDIYDNIFMKRADIYEQK